MKYLSLNRFRTLTIITSFIIFIPVISLAQAPSPRKAIRKLGPNPIIIIDSVRLKPGEISSYDPKKIATATILTDSTDIAKYGEDAKDGVAIFETKSFAKKHYLSYFRRKSSSFDSLYTISKSDSSFLYVINDKIKYDDPGDLATINDNLFLSLEIITADELKRRYQITDKQYGIIIKSKIPSNLYNADKKF